MILSFMFVNLKKKKVMASKGLFIVFTETVSDLTITKLSHCSAPVTGGQEIILLCDQVNKGNVLFLWNVFLHFNKIMVMIYFLNNVTL